MKYAYDFKNVHTRGWVRGEFEGYGMFPSDITGATSSLQAVAHTWANGTDLRLVTIDDDGNETFPAVTMKGDRGALPKDKKDR